MATLNEYLAAGACGDLLPWKVEEEAMAAFACSCATVEATALQAGLLPARYQRNRQMISLAGQLTLLQSTVAIIGCGGLGGYAVEELARLGVGALIVIDPDIFEEHNLNRQILSTVATLGRPKVEAALQRVAAINPAVQVTPCQLPFSADNGAELLSGADLVIDALDSIPVRLELAKCCRRLGLPLIHGAIGGWYGHVTTQAPGEETIETIYRNWVAGKGVEQQLGNPSFTPAVIASLQVAEACKLLLGEGRPLHGRQLHVDLLAMDLQEIGM